MTVTGDTLGGTYRRLAKIGSGGMGDVYEVEHLRLQARFAAKVLRCSGDDLAGKRPRFLREARLLAQLKSDHIVRVVDVSSDVHDPPFYVMELLEGQDLRRLLRAEQQLSVRRAVKIILDACVGVGVAHAAGLVHRDLKPENLFITHRDSGEEICKLLDFGVSKGAGPTTTETGALVGTIAYMAPEQVESAGTVTSQADVYSLGAILYELLTGRPPHRADSVERLLFKILSGTPEPIATLRPDVPVELRGIVQRALARKASERFADVSELALSLRSLVLVDGAPNTTVRERRYEPARARPASSQGRSLRLGLGAATVALLALGVLLSHRTTPAPAVRTPSLANGAASKESTNGGNPSANAAAETNLPRPQELELSALAVSGPLEQPALRETKAASLQIAKPRAKRSAPAVPSAAPVAPNASTAQLPKIRFELQNPYAR